MMPKENDLEGVQDEGGKHGGQKGMPKPEPQPKTPRRPDPDVMHKDRAPHQAGVPETRE
jgi:hypothetical protein